MSIVKLKIETLVTMGLMLSAPVVAVGVGVGADAATGKAETAQSRGDSQNVGVDTTKRLTKGGLAEAGMAAACSTSDTKCCNYSEIQGDTCCPNLKVGPTRQTLTIEGLRQIQDRQKK